MRFPHARCRRNNSIRKYGAVADSCNRCIRLAKYLARHRSPEHRMFLLRSLASLSWRSPKVFRPFVRSDGECCDGCDDANGCCCCCYSVDALREQSIVNRLPNCCCCNCSNWPNRAAFDRRTCNNCCNNSNRRIHCRADGYSGSDGWCPWRCSDCCTFAIRIGPSHCSRVDAADWPAICWPWQMSIGADAWACFDRCDGAKQLWPPSDSNRWRDDGYSEWIGAHAIVDLALKRAHAAPQTECSPMTVMVWSACWRSMEWWGSLQRLALDHWSMTLTVFALRSKLNLLLLYCCSTRNGDGWEGIVIWLLWLVNGRSDEDSP